MSLLKLSFFAVVLLAAGVLTARAQESAKFVSITNPIGKALTLNSVWVADPDYFSVEPLASLPISISPSGTIDFRVSIKPRDGVTRSTEVWYRDTHGTTSSFAVTMTAPFEQNGVQQNQPSREQPVYPNPVKDFCTMNLDVRLYPNVQVDLFNEVGGRVVGVIAPTGDKLVLDARNLASGRYNIVVSSDGNIVKNEEVVVRH
ncbi:MAG TPA: hypothetical protein VEW28_03265 [Candidatus Kapabacteria bacterium]|nr:hypothetical protein [Candidatus Kapabacteria bacterium]